MFNYLKNFTHFFEQLKIGRKLNLFRLGQHGKPHSREWCFVSCSLAWQPSNVYHFGTASGQRDGSPFQQSCRGVNE